MNNNLEIECPICGSKETIARETRNPYIENSKPFILLACNECKEFYHIVSELVKVKCVISEIGEENAD